MPKAQTSPLSLALIWIFAGIIVLLIIAYVYMTDTVVTEEREVSVTRTIYINETVQEKVYENISMGEYATNRQKYDDTPVTVRGYLFYLIERKVNVPEHIYEIVDDNGVTLELVGLSAEQKELFVKQQRTDDIYEVTGIYNRTFMGAQIIVEDIMMVPDQPFHFVDKTIQVPKEITTKELRVTNMTLWEKYFGEEDE